MSRYNTRLHNGCWVDVALEPLAEDTKGPPPPQQQQLGTKGPGNVAGGKGGGSGAGKGAGSSSARGSGGGKSSAARSEEERIQIRAKCVHVAGKTARLGSMWWKLPAGAAAARAAAAAATGAAGAAAGAGATRAGAAAGAAGMGAVAAGQAAVAGPRAVAGAGAGAGAGPRPRRPAVVLTEVVGRRVRRLHMDMRTVRATVEEKGIKELLSGVRGGGRDGVAGWAGCTKERMCWLLVL